MNDSRSRFFWIAGWIGIIGVGLTLLGLLGLGRHPQEGLQTARNALSPTTAVSASSAAGSSPAPTAPTTAPPAESPPANPDTAPGTILGPGETWRQGGLEMTLANAEVTTGFGVNDTGPGMVITMTLTNTRGTALPLHYGEGNFAATDSEGRTIQVGVTNTIYGYYFDFLKPQDVVVASGSTIYLADGPDDTDTDEFFVRDDVTSASLSWIEFSVSGISSIETAVWRIPISH